MEIGNWHQIISIWKLAIDIKDIHKTCQSSIIVSCSHALLQADRDGDGLINPDEFYRVMRKSWHPKMLRMRSYEIYGNVWRLGKNRTQHFFSSQLPLYGIHLLGFIEVCDSARLRRNHLSFSGPSQTPDFLSDERHWFTSPRRGTNPLDDWDSDEDWADQVRAEWLGGSKCNWNGSFDHLDLFKIIFPLSTVFYINSKFPWQGFLSSFWNC